CIATHPEATPSSSNQNRGIYGVDYQYESQASFSYLASRGVKTVRFAFRWERLQRALGGPLHVTELQRIKDAIAGAAAVGIEVILNVHNYGEYYLSDGTQGVRRIIGSAECTQADFADLWRRISAEFKDDGTVLGYGLMNEPAGMEAAAWEAQSQGALDTIRANGDTKVVLVHDLAGSGLQATWSKVHPKAWISDSAGNHRYEAHFYFDRNGSGNYADTYRDEVADAEERGY